MFFSDLFSRKPYIDTDNFYVNASVDGITINGCDIEIPCHMAAVRKLLGKPRVCRTKSGNVIHTYDSLGIFFYTKGNSVVYCVEFQMKELNGKRKHAPKGTFNGILTIDGKPWEKYMSNGEDTGFTRRLVLGLYKLNAEYADYCGDNKGFVGGYSGLSIEIG